MAPQLNFTDFVAQLVPGKVLYFSSDALNTPEPHYFVCIAKQAADIYILSCGTSQQKTMQALIDRKRFPNETIVFMSAADSTNPFTKDTFINCNEYFPYSIEELWYMYDERELTIEGDIPFDSYHQLVIGFHASPIIEFEIKDLLPDPDTM